MEAKELQIGDLVYGVEYRYNEDTDEEEYINHPFIITDISSNCALYSDSNGESEYLGEWMDDCSTEECIDIKPIPLTEEILKANGFDKNGFFSMKKIDTGSIKSEPLTIQLGKLFDTASVYWRCGGISQDVHISPSRLKYVHQLQHALRLCGLSELADNFKI